MRVLIACEESQEVCKAFRAKGHEAYSCDIQEPSGCHPEWHILGDAVKALEGGADCNNGWRGALCWQVEFAYCAPALYVFEQCGCAASLERPPITGRACEVRNPRQRFVYAVWWADVPRICVENPIPSKVFCLPPYTQAIQPYEYGHPYSKKTCLWLKNLPPLSSDSLSF